MLVFVPEGWIFIAINCYSPSLPVCYVDKSPTDSNQLPSLLYTAVGPLHCHCK